LRTYLLTMCTHQKSRVESIQTRKDAAHCRVLALAYNGRLRYAYTLAESSRVESSRVEFCRVKRADAACVHCRQSDFSDRAERLLFCVKKWMLQRWLH